MKKLIPNWLLAICILVAIHFNTNAQSDLWEWGKQASEEQISNYMSVNFIDFYNQVYCSVEYSEQLSVGDTLLQGGGGSGLGNTAILKYNTDGELLESLNFWGGNVHWIRTVADDRENLYVGGMFSNFMYIDDTIIYHAPGSTAFHPDVFLAKFDSEKKLLWSGLIHYEYQDDLTGLAIGDNNSIYLLTEHYANTNPSQVIFFDQDTCDTFTTPINHVVAVDSNCNIKWRREIRSDFLGTGTRDLFIGGDGLIYVYGDAYADFMVGEQTFVHPEHGSGEAVMVRYLLTFDQDGNLVDGFWFDWDVWANFISVNEAGNIFASGSLTDTAQIGDTVYITPEDHYYRIIGEFDRDLQPVWYHVMDEGPNQTVFFPSIEINSDHVLIGGSFDQTIVVDGVTLDANGYYTEGVVMKFDNDGNLLNHWMTNSTLDLNLWSVKTDNCGNLFAGGSFWRKSYFGDDILQTVSYYDKDAFFAKLQLEPDLQVDLGPDITACEEYVIEAPDDFEYFVWNDGEPVGQNWLAVTESGEYTLAAGTPGGCWAFDTVNIEIFPGISLSLGDDIEACDNYTLLASDKYSYYIWNDSLMDQYWYPVTESGFYSLAVSSDSVCWAFDTVHVEIQPDYEISLGNDTTVKLSKYIDISVEDVYDSYLWSDGSTSNMMRFVASDYGVGDHRIWLLTVDGVCDATDTLKITVEDDTGLPAYSANTLSVYPNPFDKSIFIDSPVGVHRIELSGITGKVMKTIRPDGSQAKKMSINTVDLPAGVYLVKVITGSGATSVKVVKY